MITILHHTAETGFRENLRPSDLPDALAVGGLLWVDFEGEPPSVAEPILREVFRFHPLAIDDALQETHVPKVDDWGAYLYLVLHSVIFDPNRGGQLDTLETDIFVGKTFLVTHHDLPTAPLERVRSLLARDERHLTGGIEHVLYLIADELVASFMPAIDAIEDTVDVLEDEVFDGASPRVVERIFGLKRSLLRMRRIVAPQREVLNKLARDSYPVITPAARVFFRDVYDHLVRVYDITENLRDLVSGALDTYLSVVNNRMNEIMKTLTLITTLFMPLSFVTGFFGMNFFGPVIDLSTWTGMPAFVVLLAVLLATPLGMYLWMRRRAWM
ncbi:MAG: magnesium/cobalt transporter CorA [Anaerolineae bacterium]